jgi:hypothetical protein
MGADLHDESIGDLLKRLSQETSTLVRQELELAKAEATEKGKQAGKGAGMLGGAGVALRGRDQLKDAGPPVPEQTVQTVKEDVRWAKNRTRSGSR